MEDGYWISHSSDCDAKQRNPNDGQKASSASTNKQVPSLEQPSVSIEILPGGVEQWSPQASEDFPFVLVDNNLGIPQKLLYKLYLSAVALYKNADDHTILTLSPVILLANPAHQTALNARKRLVASGALQSEEELNLVALLIGGSKEFAKQSITWDHRRWLFRHLYERIEVAEAGLVAEPPGWATSEEVSLFPMIPLGTLEQECQLIRRACELYPRNYHAWVHYHWVLNVAQAVVVSNSREPPDPGFEDHIRFLRQEVSQLRGWIDRHVSDYSAVHLLCSMAMLDCAGALQLAESGRGRLVDELVGHAQGLVLCYPSHETLWLYLRNVLSLSLPNVIYDIVNQLRREHMPSVAIEKYIASLV
ncbi:hypothetical protein NP233_g1349 [Leucocoprinus birnbaumii]|uniref:Protein prenyltransferase alpha subunit repeat-containing protein 1 n=1 Tax=Leucocoprinus birnbaumii TaxID=56174 RepID=A0AAD5W0P6_9AGAR|nr:hypothetical protein NP233_g1349 [Leucocoprinus birnbaumii]